MFCFGGTRGQKPLLSTPHQPEVASDVNNNSSHLVLSCPQGHPAVIIVIPFAFEDRAPEIRGLDNFISIGPYIYIYIYIDSHTESCLYDVTEIQDDVQKVISG